jgi:hypothetical protein
LWRGDLSPPGREAAPNTKPVARKNLWRGSLLPLEREALTKMSLPPPMLCLATPC